MPLKRAAPHLRPCLLLPSCSLGWMQRSVQLRGGSRARGNLAVPVCTLPGAPWEMGPADRTWGSHHPLPAAPLFLQPWLAEMGKVLDSQCFKEHGLSLLHPPGTQQSTKLVWACSSHRLWAGRVYFRGQWRPQALDTAQEQAHCGHMCVCVLAVVSGTLLHVHFC